VQRQAAAVPLLDRIDLGEVDRPGEGALDERERMGRIGQTRQALAAVARAGMDDGRPCRLRRREAGSPRDAAERLGVRRIEDSDGAHAVEGEIVPLGADAVEAHAETAGGDAGVEIALDAGRIELALGDDGWHGGGPRQAASARTASACRRA
jgi:hypothetical protein